jgi:hypothetical protein
MFIYIIATCHTAKKREATEKKEEEGKRNEAKGAGKLLNLNSLFTRFSLSTYLIVIFDIKP